MLNVEGVKVKLLRLSTCATCAGTRRCWTWQLLRLQESKAGNEEKYGAMKMVIVWRSYFQKSLLASMDV